jgi:hypothetical protein
LLALACPCTFASLIRVCLINKPFLIRSVPRFSVLSLVPEWSARRTPLQTLLLPQFGASIEKSVHRPTPIKNQDILKTPSTTLLVANILQDHRICHRYWLSFIKTVQKTIKSSSAFYLPQALSNGPLRSILPGVIQFPAYYCSIHIDRLWILTINWRFHDQDLESPSRIKRLYHKISRSADRLERSLQHLYHEAFASLQDQDFFAFANRKSTNKHSICSVQPITLPPQSYPTRMLHHRIGITSRVSWLYFETMIQSSTPRYPHLHINAPICYSIASFCDATTGTIMPLYLRFVALLRSLVCVLHASLSKPAFI